MVEPSEYVVIDLAGQLGAKQGVGRELHCEGNGRIYVRVGPCVRGVCRHVGHGFGHLGGQQTAQVELDEGLLHWHQAERLKVPEAEDGHLYCVLFEFDASS